jgi:hypothetical protein
MCSASGSTFDKSTLIDTCSIQVNASVSILEAVPFSTSHCTHVKNKHCLWASQLLKVRVPFKHTIKNILVDVVLLCSHKIQQCEKLG